MEKYVPHYSLNEIQAQMITAQAMNITVSALKGMRAAGMAHTDALTVMQRLGRKDFYKSMTTHSNNRIWQDVYHGEWNGISLYIKFQRVDEYFVVSFKEL